MLEFLQSVNPLHWLVAGGALFLLGVALMIWLLARGAREKKALPLENTLLLGVRPPARAGERAYVSSLVGNRASQQDYALVPGEGIPESALAEKGCLALVCDGMGGMQGGERASHCCAELLQKSYYENDFPSPAAFYASEIPKADEAVASLKGADGARLGAGTTLVAVILKGDRAYCASVGDSRIYLFRDGELIQLTRDHNYLLTLSEMVRASEIDMDVAMAHPQREALISYVGMGTGPDIVDIDEEGFPVNAGDLILLCSDGLYKAMSREEIARVIAENGSGPAALPGLLTSAAFAKGWIMHDNITAAIVSCTP